MTNLKKWAKPEVKELGVENTLSRPPASQSEAQHNSQETHIPGLAFTS